MAEDEDPVTQAATAISESPPEDKPGDSPEESQESGGVQKEGKYYRPDQFTNHPLAKKINRMMDKLDPLEGETPATEHEVGESYAATLAELTDTGVEIHPGWIALMNTTFFGMAVGMHFVEARAGSSGESKGKGRETPPEDTVSEVPDFGSLTD